LLEVLAVRKAVPAAMAAIDQNTEEGQT
jgi:hypothetical protein